MITGISDTTPAAAAAASTGVHSGANSQSPAGTAFGDVLVDQTAAADFLALFGHRDSSAAASTASTTATGTSAPQAAASTSAGGSGLTTAATQALAVSAAALNVNGGQTAESLFGTDIFLQNPGGHGPNGTQWGYNPAYFATRHTADIVAQMLGGTVVERNDICSSGAGSMVQDQPNELVQLSNGKLVNAGLVADIFNHDHCQVMINKMLQEAVENAYDPSAV